MVYILLKAHTHVFEDNVYSTLQKSSQYKKYVFYKTEAVLFHYSVGVLFAI